MAKIKEIKGMTVVTENPDWVDDNELVSVKKLGMDSLTKYQTEQHKINPRNKGIPPKKTVSKKDSSTANSHNKVKNADAALEKSNRGSSHSDRQLTAKAGGIPVRREVLLATPPIEVVSKEQLKKIYPIRVSDDVLETCVNVINNNIKEVDVGLREVYRDNLFGMIDIIKNTKTKTNFKDYVKAVEFCVHKMNGETAIRAYTLTFPDRIARFEAEGVATHFVHVYAGAYAKGKLVTDILARMMVPTHVMYMDYFHKAVKTQVELMTDERVSPKVRAEAANSLMTHLKQPVVQKAELNIGIEESDTIKQLSEAMDKLSGMQQEKILDGSYTVTDIAKAEIYEIDSNG